MTTFKAHCTDCGELNEQHTSEIVLIHYGNFELFYRFHCLFCGERSQAAADPRVRTALAACGVPVLRLNRHYDEALEERERIDREVDRWSQRLATARVEDFEKV